MAEQLIWTQSQVLNNVERVAMRNLTRAAMYVVGIIVQSISVGQAVRRTRSGHLVGLNPSRPGNPPHVLFGALRRSITYKVFKSGGQLVALVGSAMVYARRLELGFMGTDKLGRRYSQGPRPYLKPAVRNNRPTILRIVSTGS